MNIVKIPYPCSQWKPGTAKTTPFPALKTIEIKKWLTDQGLVEMVDFDCHYMSGEEHIHVKFWSPDTESVASMLALTFL
jgi:hypothetical protein